MSKFSRRVTGPLMIILISLMSACTVEPNAGSTPSADKAPSAVTARVDRMSNAELAGQVIMMGVPSTGVSQSHLAKIRQYHIGAVILNGNSELSVESTAKLTARLQQANATTDPDLFISTDQEGGIVQRLRGPGFTRIPSAVEQGKLSPRRLRQDTAVWAKELERAGVNITLGPVLDTVPKNQRVNPPIGDLKRQFGSSPDVVFEHGVAVCQGLAEGRIHATIKHFPGLGRVTGNTDTTSGVTDTITTRDDPYIEPFAKTIKLPGSVPFVMMSTATYTQIDPKQPAAFSSTVITDLLREDLGYQGIVISDDLGVAKQVTAAEPSVGKRATRFIDAGGTMVLTVKASQIPAMTTALAQKAKSDPRFKAKLRQAAATILQLKHASGMLK